MTILINNQAINAPTGVTELGPVSLPNGFTTMTCRVKRCTTATPLNWPLAATTLDCQVFVSADGGATWVPSGAFTSFGGIVLRPDGSEATESTLVVSGIPPGVSRQIRATLIVAIGPLVSSATLEAA